MKTGINKTRTINACGCAVSVALHWLHDQRVPHALGLCAGHIIDASLKVNEWMGFARRTARDSAGEKPPRSAAKGCPVLLVGSQGVDRIDDAGGPARRLIAGQDGRQDENGRNCGDMLRPPCHPAGCNCRRGSF
jgi:hypothetical protein